VVDNGVVGIANPFKYGDWVLAARLTIIGNWQRGHKSMIFCYFVVRPGIIAVRD
jgi:hypothetical protein